MLEAICMSYLDFDLKRDRTADYIHIRPWPQLYRSGFRGGGGGSENNTKKEVALLGAERINVKTVWRPLPFNESLVAPY